MERVRDFFKRHLQEPQGNNHQEEEDLTTFLTTEMDRPVAPSQKASATFIDRDKLRDEVIAEAKALAAAKEAIGAGIGVASPKEINRWGELQQEWDDIEAIREINHDRFREFDKAGATSWIEVAVIHAIDLGSELVVQRNIRQQLAIARKNGAEVIARPYFKLLEFHFAQVSAVKIGKVAFPDFASPKDKPASSFYCFLVKGILSVRDNLGDQIVQDNLEPPKNVYPNLIKSALWVFPNKIQSLLTLDPSLLEQAYRNERSPLNEMGLAVSSIIRGIQEVRSRMLRTVLDPHSKDFPEAKRILQNYLLNSDQTTIILALNILGLNQNSNIRKLYLESRRHLSRGIDREFYSLLANSAQVYAKEASRVVHISSEDDMDLIADLNQALDSSIPVPNLEQLGVTVSAIFQKSSQKVYEVNPDDVDWQTLYSPQTVKVQFDKDKPKKFNVELGYEDDDGGTMEVKYGFDVSKGLMDWKYFADPLQPENDHVANFRSLLLHVTSSILTTIQKQAESQHQQKQTLKSSIIVTPTTSVKRERFEDPIYQLRKEAKAKQRQAGTQNLFLKEDISAAELTQSAGIKDMVMVPEIDELSKMMRYISSRDQEIVGEAIAEFNRFGTGAELKKMDNLGPDGEPRWSLDIRCTVPKGVRVVLASAEFSPGSREFRPVGTIRYRKDVYRHNQL